MLYFRVPGSVDFPMKQAAHADFCFSPPDCGTWISPPAQCPGLQPISPSHGHWDSIRSHQIVSFKPLGESSLTSTQLVQLWRHFKCYIKYKFASKGYWNTESLPGLGVILLWWGWDCLCKELRYSSNRSWADADIKQDSALAMQKVRLDLA